MPIAFLWILTCADKAILYLDIFCSKVYKTICCELPRTVMGIMCWCKLKEIKDKPVTWKYWFKVCPSNIVWQGFSHKPLNCMKNICSVNVFQTKIKSIFLHVMTKASFSWYLSFWFSSGYLPNCPQRQRPHEYVVRSEHRGFIKLLFKHLEIGKICFPIIWYCSSWFFQIT